MAARDRLSNFTVIPFIYGKKANMILIKMEIFSPFGP